MCIRDSYNILWVKDTVSNVDFVNGFIEDYGDPLGRKANYDKHRSSPECSGNVGQGCDNGILWCYDSCYCIRTGTKYVEELRGKK